MINKFIACMLLCCLWMLSIGAVYAQDIDTSLPSTTNYDGLDIIFLVDQSGSMGGADYGFSPAGRGYDPLGLRFEAVHYALMMLGQYRLSIAPDIQMRMSVINFGDNADISDPASHWVNIAPTGRAEDWDIAFEQISNTLSSDSFRQRHSPANLENTNFFAAFDAAQTRFSELPSDNKRYLRAVVLLTDGAPCVPQSFDCNDFSAQQQHMRNVIELTKGAFPSDDYVVFVLTLDATGVLWDRWRSDWQQITQIPERTSLATDSQQVGIRFLNILMELMAIIQGNDDQSVNVLNMGENRVFIPPYLAEIRLSIFKSSLEPGMLEIIKPSGLGLSNFDPEVDIYNRDRPIEVWRISNPEPGDWIFRVDDEQSHLDIYMEFIPVDISVQIEEKTYYQYNTISLSFDLLDASGNPLVIYGPPYDLNVTADLLMPDGETQSIPVTTQGGSNYKIDIYGGQVGAYSMGIHAVSMMPLSQPHTIFSRQQAAEFEVIGIRLDANMPIDEFLSGSIYDLHVTLTDSNNQPLDIEEAKITIDIARNGDSQTYEIGSSDNHVFDYSLNLDDAGNYNLIVNANITQGNGDILTLPSLLETSFRVIPSQRLILQLVIPETNDFVQETTTGFPPFTPTNFDLVFDVVDESGNRVVLGEIAETDVTWLLDVVKDGQLFDSNHVHIQEDANILGRYYASFGDLEAGEYEISIKPSGDLTAAYIFDPLDSLLSINLVRIVSLPYSLTILGIVVLVIICVMLIVFAVRRRINRRKHPARGMIVIREAASGIPRWSVNFDAKRSNHIIYKGRALKPFNISEIQIICSDEKMSQAKRIRVTIKQGKDIICNDRLLSPGSPPIRLTKNSLGLDLPEEGRITYELVKDPDSLY